MCGIVAIIGKDNACKHVLDGLKKLEYRGYDSSGLAYILDKKMFNIKSVGKLNQLINTISENKFSNLELAKVAIGHTRWATHGKVNIKNAHPIIYDKKIAVVHNGIIENYEKIKEKIFLKKYKFETSTDTEVIPVLIDNFIKKGKNFFESAKSTLNLIDGAYAFAAIHQDFPNEIFVSRNTSPLVIGVGEDFKVIGSDAHSITQLVSQVIYLEDGDYALIKDKVIQIFDKNGQITTRKLVNVNSNLGFISKDGYRHFMEKEIFEQPTVLINTISSLLKEDNIININTKKRGIEKNKALMISAAGTSFYAAIVAKYWIEKIANISVSVELASEYRYRKPASAGFSSMIVISQSGESIDTLMAMREAKKLNLKTTAIVNVEGSTIDRESDYSIYTRVGPEIGVASTKSFTSQLTVLFLIAIKLASENKSINNREFETFLKFTKSLPNSLSKCLKINHQVIEIAQKIKNTSHTIFLGRGDLYPLALEGALKLKEISYIHAEGFAAGEMKHGPIALIEENLPVIMFLISDGLEDKSISNLQEAVSRGAKTILVADKKSISKAKFVNFSIEIPDFEKKFASTLSPILMAIPAQLLAYHVARERGTDVDQPRNLAKSVTVE